MNAAAIAALRERKFHLGTWLSIGSPVIAELAGEIGFDWLLFDLEHGCGSEAALFSQLQATRGTKSAAIVRVGALQPDLISRVLDWGADGIMVPHISSEAEALACVKAAHYPPAGKRGVARSTRAIGYGLRPVETAVAPFIFVQIEDHEGVEQSGKIAAVPGIDALFVGPADLRFDLETREPKAPRDFDACLAHVASAASAAGKQSGILLREPAEVARLRELGFTTVAVDSDLGLVRAGFQRLRSSIQ
jgi:2-dehydro-3-deoxyglucarate aldolase/4-hydroxy-2-oxoheptanedioate aldolase